MAMLSSFSTWAGPDDRPRETPIPNSPVAPNFSLDLSHEVPSGMAERVPATVISPIFRTYIQPIASDKALKSLKSNNEELAGEQLIRAMEQQAKAANNNSLVCLNRQGNESSGGGINWSLNDGFGFYVQGKGFKQLQKLMKRTDICPAGDPSPVCRTLPKQVCD